MKDEHKQDGTGTRTLMQRTGFAGTLAEYIQQQIEEVRQTVGAGRVLLALSGGVDSSVRRACAQGDRRAA